MAVRDPFWKFGRQRDHFAEADAKFRKYERAVAVLALVAVALTILLVMVAWYRVIVA